MQNFRKLLVIMIVCLWSAWCFAGAALADGPIKLRISSGVSSKHCWTAGHMEPFADAIEAQTKGKVKFYRFVAGELCKAGKGLECLRGGSADVVAPFLPPYHAGVFPLTDVTMLPVMNTDAMSITKAFQALMDSKVPLKDGKTFYELEVSGNGLKAWPLGPTQPYVISTSGKRFKTVDDIKGTPIRAGARMHLIFIEKLGATAVYMTGMDAYEAFSRGAIQGIVFSIPDWKAYGFLELIKYTITGLGLGHFPGYMAMTAETWNKLPPDVQKTWDQTARKMAIESAKYWIKLSKPTVAESKNQYKAVFEDVKNLDPGVQKRIAQAGVETWKTWIQEEEKKGNPARATAKLWAKLVKEQGGVLPDGVETFLNAK